MSKKSLPYKEPTIVRNQSGDWYVQYYFKNPSTQKFVAFKERKGINYFKDPKEKEAAAEDLRSLVSSWLREGNGPFDVEAIVVEKIRQKKAELSKVKKQKESWTLVKAIERYRKWYSEQGFSPDTVRTYRKYMAAFEEWVIKNELDNQYISKFTEMDLQGYMQEMYEENDWSGRTYNNYLEAMLAFFSRSLKLEKTERRLRSLEYDFDPDNLETKPAQPQRNKSFTPIQVEAIKKELAKHGNENLKDYCEWIFLSLMRPKEIRHLKIEDIDHVSRQIRINGKTGDRLIPISDQLMKVIERRGLMKNNSKCYVFGYTGNVDGRRMSVAYFLTKFAAIKSKLKLDENYGPYSFKPTGVIRMIKAGFKDEEIRVLTGHKTQTAFEAYKRDLVIDNSHVMKGATIDF